MIKLLFTTLILTSVSSCLAATADKAGNGGDDIGLEVQSSAVQGALLLSAKLLDPKDAKKLGDMVSRARYVVVDETLYAELPGAEQESVALNFSDLELIYVNRERWTLLEPMEKIQIALHEVLGLVGLEKTGDYHLSLTLKNPPEPRLLPGARVLYEDAYDRTDRGLPLAEAQRTCELQKNLHKKSFVIVYCAYVEKKAAPDDFGQVSAPSVYGLKVLGAGPRDRNTPWVAIFSSLDATVPGLYSSEDAAMETCTAALLKSLPEQPLWPDAKCFVKTQDSRFYFEIKTQYPF